LCSVADKVSFASDQRPVHFGLSRGGITRVGAPLPASFSATPRDGAGKGKGLRLGDQSFKNFCCKNQSMKKLEERAWGTPHMGLTARAIAWVFFRRDWTDWGVRRGEEGGFTGSTFHPKAAPPIIPAQAVSIPRRPVGVLHDT